MSFSAHQPSVSAQSHDSIFVERFVLGDGPLSVAVKDVVDIKGRKTRLGSKAFADVEPAQADAEIITHLLAGGATIIGKTNMHELAYGVTGINQVYGTPHNPLFPGIIPGGSSSGSAVAVASGFCDASIGTDTGGSIRVPAACCGVFGLKPTFGRVSRVGLTPKNSSLDCVGPFAVNPDMLSQVMSMIADDWAESISHSDSIKVGWLECDAQTEIIESTKAVSRAFASKYAEVETSLLNDAHRAGLIIIAKETYAAFSHLLPAGKVDGEVAKRLHKASDISDIDLEQAEDTRRNFTIEIDNLLEEFDVLALPTLAGFPPMVDKAEDLQKMVEITSLCRPFNLSGHPAIAIPLPAIDQKPVSLQLVARHGDDEKLITYARLIANLTGMPSKLNGVKNV